jgi:all-trans-8'-apo-beta-carotenal 15,15'-oxygenase
VTQNFYIFDQAPLKFNPIPLLLGQKSLTQAIDFDSTSSSILHLIPRDGSPAKQIKIPSHFVFHFCNAYEENDKIIIGCYPLTHLSAYHFYVYILD